MKRRAPLALSIVLALIWVFSAYETVARDVLAAQGLACEATPAPPPPDCTVPQPLHAPSPGSTAGALPAPKNLRIVQAGDARTRATRICSGVARLLCEIGLALGLSAAYSAAPGVATGDAGQRRYSAVNSRSPAVSYDRK